MFYICINKMRDKPTHSKIKAMTTKEKRQKEEQKLIKRAIDMYISVHGEEPKSWWCTSAGRAITLLNYYKEQFNIIG